MPVHCSAIDGEIGDYWRRGNQVACQPLTTSVEDRIVFSKLHAASVLKIQQQDMRQAATNLTKFDIFCKLQSLDLISSIYYFMEFV
jgi:hypothetical protein